MATIKNFEDLKAWQKARELAGCVYDLTRKQKFSRDFGLCNQIQEAAGSAMHNIAEGFESGYDPEFIRFLKWLVVREVKSNRNCISRSMLAILRKMNLRKLMILPLMLRINQWHDLLSQQKLEGEPLTSRLMTRRQGD